MFRTYLHHLLNRCKLAHIKIRTKIKFLFSRNIISQNCNLHLLNATVKYYTMRLNDVKMLHLILKSVFKFKINSKQKGDNGVEMRTICISMAKIQKHFITKKKRKKKSQKE